MKSKNYVEAKNIKELGQILKLPKKEAARVEMRTSLAVAVRRRIKSLGLTHVEAAKWAGVGRTVITTIMIGDTTSISTERLIDIAHGLGLTVTLKVA